MKQVCEGFAPWMLLYDQSSYYKQLALIKDSFALKNWVSPLKTKRGSKLFNGYALSVAVQPKVLKQKVYMHM